MKDMSIQHWFVIALGFVLILGLTSPTTVHDTTDLNSDAINFELDELISLAYIPHDPIYIDENSDFPFYATAGDGSSGNPWVIENLEIDSNNTATPCIYIRDTIDYFLIRNCNLTGASTSPGAGVSLYNVWYGEISNNTITNNRYGIFLDSTVQIDMINNTCNNNYYGIYLYDNSWHNDMVNNTCNSNYAGIYIDYDSSINTIRNATCNGNSEYGIYIQDGSDAIIANSSCLHNQHGVYIENLGEATMVNNILEYNHVGITCYDAPYCTLANSICNYNDFGIAVVAGSHHVTLTDNTVCSNYDIGFILTAYYTTIVNNNISYNANWGMDNSGGMSYGTVIGNTMNGNGHGNRFSAASTSFVDNEFCYNSDTGLLFSAGSENTIVNNSCNNNGGSGITIYDYTQDTIVTNNTCNNNELHGLYLGEYTLNVTVAHNMLSNNSFVTGARGVFIHSITMNHTIIWNIFVDNFVDAEDQQGPSYEGIGPNLFDYNYWSDYGGVDANNDSIGDTPYSFTGNSDPHPLMLMPTPPKWNETPTDQTITEFDVLYYDLNVTSPSPVTWAVDDTGNFTIDANGTLTSNGILPIGEYDVKVNVTNIYNFTTKAEFTVIVVEGISPTWDFTPVSQIIEFGEPFYYDVNATDPSGIDEWWLSDAHSPYFSIDSAGVIRNATILDVSVYDFTINVNDTYGNELSITIAVTVEDTVLPSWVTTPENQVIEYGETFSYDVDAIDLAGISTWWLNRTDFSIDSSGLITNATVLAVGVYGLEVFCNDTHGNVQSAIITVTVEAPPTTTTPTSTTTTPTTDTTTPTLPTTPTGTTPSGLDPMLLLALGGVGAIVVLVIVFVFLKKKS
jgi:parallel beta-helix repeat protein